MFLPNAEQRQSYGIDSLERAIVFSALLLRAGYGLSDDKNVKDAVQISLSLAGVGERFTQTINLRVSLHISNNALAGGANLLHNIVERFTGTVAWTASSSPSITGTPLPTVPIGLSLEQFFFWASQQLLALDTTNYRRIAITPIFKGVADVITLEATVAIGFDYATYLLTNNLITAVGAIVDDDNDDTPNFGNDYQLNNEQQLNGGTS